MKSIRIGNDIRIEWPLVLSGDVAKLDELDLTVEVRPSARVIDTRNYADAPGPGEVTVMMNGGVRRRPGRPCPPYEAMCAPCPPPPVMLPWHIEDGKLIAMWTADRQLATGDYDIILHGRKNEGGQATCDQYRFVRLVAHTAEADAPADSGVEAVIAMQPVTLELSGLSAYEVAVVNGFEGTVEEWLESLRQPGSNVGDLSFSPSFSALESVTFASCTGVTAAGREQWDGKEFARLQADGNSGSKATSLWGWGDFIISQGQLKNQSPGERQLGISRGGAKSFVAATWNFGDTITIVRGSAEPLSLASPTDSAAVTLSTSDNVDTIHIGKDMTVSESLAATIVLRVPRECYIKSYSIASRTGVVMTVKFLDGRPQQQYTIPQYDAGQAEMEALRQELEAKPGATTAEGGEVFNSTTMNMATAKNSHAEGIGTTASGNDSHAEGNTTTASGNASHAEGTETTAQGEYSHAEGSSTTASGDDSHAEGYNTTASGNDSHAEGSGTEAAGECSHAEGKDTLVGASYAHAEGLETDAEGDGSHAEGHKTITSGDYSHAEGSTTTTNGNNSHAEGESTEANGDCSHAEGKLSVASGLASHAEGSGTTAGAEAAHAEGNGTTASGDASHAEGLQCQALMLYSHAEGQNCTVDGGIAAHAEGIETYAEGDGSHAEGIGTNVANAGGHAEGIGTKAINDYEHAEGSYNKSNSGSTDDKKTRHSVGIGTSATERKNAFEIMANGDIYMLGIGGYDGTNATDETTKTLQEVLAALAS